MDAAISKAQLSSDILRIQKKAFRIVVVTEMGDGRWE
jgi:hypothetical protein